ncbi:glycosyltransferase family 4 protein [Paenibacillus sp. FSL R7-0272]|uniref:glycosyltransferase family 4 protein n=1 Tax=Paenibacillus sp. FSL R7-0272 TaxID=2921679 RepID=UPI0030EC49FF
MKKLAYFSPLNPIKSGISDYSEDLIPYLNGEFDIDVYIPNNFQMDNIELQNKINIKEFYQFDELYNNKEYDAVLYHMGNNYTAHNEIYEFAIKYPGVVVLHDYSLHHFFAAKTLEQGNISAYKEEMFYCHGNEGLNKVNEFLNHKIPPIWETDSLNYPLNLRLLDRSAGIIVHSQFASEMLKKQAPYAPISVVPLPAPLITDIDLIYSKMITERETLGISKDDFVICALGYANHTKRIDKVIEALKLIKENKLIRNFKFFIVGEIAESYPLQDLIKKSNLVDEVICTGYVSLNQFDQYIAASNMCVNLRYPTQGENSASLLKILGHGKPVIATDIGSFSEFPDEVVYKIGYVESEVDEIIKTILKILDENKEVKERHIINYIQQNNCMAVCLANYKKIISEIIYGQQNNVNLSFEKYVSEHVSNLSEMFIELNDNKIIDQYIDGNLEILVDSFLKCE